jgi:hypothetical protein
MISPEELESLLKDTDWSILKIVKENGYYGGSFRESLNFGE